MRKILVPTDFSPNALAAFCYAVPFAAQFDADLVVAHVIKRPNLPDGTPLEEYERVMGEQEQQAWQEMHQQVAQKKEALPAGQEVEVTPLIISNAFVKGMNQLVAQESVSLIIMGTKGASGLRRLFVGTNTADMVANAVVPVLAIPEDYPFRGIRKVLVALHPGQVRDMAPLHLLRSLVQAWHPAVTVLTVTQGREEGEAGKEEKKAQVEEMLGMAPTWVEVKSRDPAKSIQGLVDASPPDLLVLTPQPKNLWQELFGSSVAQDFVFSPANPVLFLPPRGFDIFKA